MKRLLTVFIAICLMVCSFSACSRRDKYQDILDSQYPTDTTEADTPAVMDEDTEVDGYKATIIKKTGDTPYYKGKTVADLEALFKTASRGSNAGTLTATGKYYNVSFEDYTEQNYYYNKLTGNITEWCSDPLCELGDKCVWFWSKILYIGEEHIYFASEYDGNKWLYRSDLQRNNVEKVYDIPGNETVKVEYATDDTVFLYYKSTDTSGKTLNSLYALTIGEEVPVKISGDLNVGSNLFNSSGIYYSLVGDPERTCYRTDHAFTSSTPMWDNAKATAMTERYIIVGEYTEDIMLYPSFIYDTETEKTYPLVETKYECVIAGDYVYFERDMTEEEMADDPMRDYYTYTWEYKRKIMHGRTSRGGRIYRIKISDLGKENAAECVLQVTYDGVPVRIEDFEVDGDVIYLSFKNHEEYKNYFNQDYDDSTSNHQPHHAVADLQNGTVTFLEFEKE